MRSNRRGFLQSVAAAGAAVPTAAASPAAAPEVPAGTAPPAGSAPSVTYPRRFAGRQLSQIAFPLGGVGAGSLSLGGRGQLRDWEIFNRADKGRSPAYAFPAIWAQVGQSKPVVRVLEARIGPPYQGFSGLGSNNVPGLSRLASATFIGEYPLARVDFRDTSLPVTVGLEAFTPIYPLDADESGLPVAVLRYRVVNRAKKAALVSIAFAVDNPVGPAAPRGITDMRRNQFRGEGALRGLIMDNPGLDPDEPDFGSFVLGVIDPGLGKLSNLAGWPQGRWWASPLLYWDDFSADGELGPQVERRNAVGSLCLQREIAAGAAADYTFVLAWHFPNRTPAVCGWSAPKGDENAIIGNYYSRRFPDAWAAAKHLASNLNGLERRTRQFLDAMRATTLPSQVKEAAMANLSTLASTTCFRTADGVFRGFEGVRDQKGCCPGSCTHVWNYESTTQFVFPTLARSMREAAFRLAERMGGCMPIRLVLPEGKQTTGLAAADGQMGQIMKAYLDWQLSGDEAWLRRIWPSIKGALEYAWIANGWDADRDGVLEGVQHNTYDVEFFGPNPQCGVYYLGALRAAEEMARGVGDASSAAEYHRLFTKGSTWIDQNIFNGEYYYQKIQGVPRDSIPRSQISTMGADDTMKPDFQLGDGCLVDQLVGQYVADFCGLGPLLDHGNIRRTAQSIYRYNYKRSMAEHDSVQRAYALNDEAALVICDYGKGKRPHVPFPYFAEVMTGFEYSAAILMLQHGMVKEGLECIANIRARYDGDRRNPWDEAECGHHYARAMAAWSALPVLSGFDYSGPAKRLRIAPLLRSSGLVSIWSTATGWGTFSKSKATGGARLILSVLFGGLPLKSVHLAEPGETGTATLSGKKLDFDLRRSTGRAEFAFRELVEIREGQQLQLFLRP